MKKIDKLVLRAFFGPFIITLAVVIFILLMRIILAYFTDLFGKDLGVDVYGDLFGYFTLISMPVGMPLAILLATLMCFGNLGEFSELTAIKAAGISINRAFLPIFLAVLAITGFSVWYNNTVQPWANLKGYRLLYDIKTTKATLNIKEGIFYEGIPGYSIKVAKKFADNKTLKDIIIYNHMARDGNKDITIADSAQMYTILGKQFLVFELFNGANYIDDADKSNANIDQSDFAVNRFKKSKMIMDLSSFGMSKTGEEQFTYHPLMKNLTQLNAEGDSLRRIHKSQEDSYLTNAQSYFLYHFRTQNRQKVDSLKGDWATKRFKGYNFKESYRRQQVANFAYNQARNMISFAESNESMMVVKKMEYSRMDLEWHHKFTTAIAIFVMFLIGAPLGAIIRKGGFGMPVILAVSFFILSYVLTINSDKWAKELVAPVLPSAWFSNGILLLIGLYFLYKARNDSRLFEADNYKIWFERLKSQLSQYEWTKKLFKIRT